MSLKGKNCTGDEARTRAQTYVKRARKLMDAAERQPIWKEQRRAKKVALAMANLEEARFYAAVASLVQPGETWQHEVSLERVRQAQAKIPQSVAGVIEAIQT